MTKRRLPFTVGDTATLIAVALFLGWMLYDQFVPPYFGARDGRLDATRDIQAGNLKILAFGKPDLSYRHLPDLFQDRYGVTLENLGCCPMPYSRAHADAYNETVTTHIRTIHPDFDLERAYNQLGELAHARFKQEHPEWFSEP